MKTILVVDDSVTMRRMIMATLHALPEVSFDQAGTGLEAIERLAVAPVDLVLLDLNMPDMHGLEVLRFARQHPALRELPIVVLTTRDDDEIRAEAYSAGATLYLTKPFGPETLTPAIAKLLQGVEHQ